ncbi:unnamed protein product [Thlaspi arvense]|uniref:Uncharacterized protein n=1 Tax=Thlaspi arvense TaxID=13288 RepID=A0AAU9RHZ7_THLAR|nr:unnamed protein product [Thlaspi arvense]
MAMTLAALSLATIASATSRPSQQSKIDMRFISELNSFERLKAHNSVAALGLPVSIEWSFAKVISSLRLPLQGDGGALSSTCKAIGKIFRIAAIMNGLVLIGVAVSFMLLPIEASLEESK